MGTYQTAVLAVVIVLVLAYLARVLGLFRGGREGFASQRAREVHDRAKEVFDEGGGDAPYSKYRSRVPGADPVQYSDVRTLYRGGGMTPEAVEGVL